MDNKYESGCGVVELEGKDFTNGNINNDCVKNKFGILKAYAPFCHFCTDMVDDMKFLGKELNKNGIAVCALNTQNEKNREISQKLQIGGIPSLFMIKQGGELENIDNVLQDRSVGSILNVICDKTTEYSKNNNQYRKRCCRKVNDKIHCD